MNKHLDEYLCNKYPLIFEKRNAPMQESCMYWGFSCRNGWFYLIDKLCASLQHHIDHPQYVEQRGIVPSLKRLWNKTGWNLVVYPLIKRLPSEEYMRISKYFQFNVPYIPGPPIRQVVAEQVKEKFCGLRFYVSGGDDHCQTLISFAETFSYHICEKCGRTDELVTTAGNNWIRTLCPCCVEKPNKESHMEVRDIKLCKIWERVRQEEYHNHVNPTEPWPRESSLKTVKAVMKRSKKKK